MTKTVLEINKRAAEGRAVVLTEFDLLSRWQRGEELTVADLDVVAMGFQADLAGTAAMLLVPVAERGEFTRARRIWLNGVPGYPGPAPNERLGVVDTLIFADAYSQQRQSPYTGADLFIDLLEDKSVEAECVSIEGGTYRKCFHLRELQFARFYCYNLYLPKDRQIGIAAEQNAHLMTVQTGAKLLLNGVPAVAAGCGTRSSAGQRSLSLAADLFEMKARALRRTNPGNGPAIAHSVGLAIPVLNEEVLCALKRCLMNTTRQPQGAIDLEVDEAAALDLKERVGNGTFMLTESGRPLWYETEIGKIPYDTSKKGGGAVGDIEPLAVGGHCGVDAKLTEN